MSHIHVNTSNATICPVGHVLISANLRETEGKTVDAALRYRNIVIPELTITSGVQSSFAPVLIEKLYELAKAQFEAAMKASNRLQKSVPAESYTVAGLLAFHSELANSGRLSNETVAAWFKESATAAKILGKRDAATVASYCAKYAKFSSPNNGTNAPTCRALLATLEAADLDHPIATILATRLQATITKSEEVSAEAL